MLLALPSLRARGEFGAAAIVEALIGAHFPMDVTVLDDHSAALSSSNTLGGIRVSAIDAPAHIASRGPGHIGRDTGRRAAVCYYLEGTIRIEQGGVESLVQPGEFAIFDWESPFTLTAPAGYRAVVLQLPSEAILAPLETFRKKVSTGIRPPAGLARIVPSFFSRLADDCSRLGGPAGERVARSAVELACAAHAERLRSPEVSPPRSPDFIQASLFAEEHLADPQLDAQRIAAAIFVSTRQLHKIFQAEGTTVSRWIRNRRLEKCRGMLTDPELHWMSVGDIGAAWGFFNRAHFSRIYRAAYGCSPRSHRDGGPE